MDIQEKKKLALENHTEFLKRLSTSVAIIERGEEKKFVWLYNTDHPYQGLQKVSISYLKTEYPAWASITDKISIDKFIFDPTLPMGIIKTADFIFFNRYLKPLWMEKFDQRLSYSLPTLFSSFLDHLTKNNSKSKEYILDWMSWSLYPKTYTPFIVFLGDEGVGKGLLGDILEKLHAPNSTKTRDTIVKKDFNRPIQDKTFVHIDELKLRNDEDLNKLKDLINRRVEVEVKGKDACSTSNWAKIMISSNNRDALDLSDSQRRFSIMDITDTPSHHASFVQNLFTNHLQFVNALLDDHHIQEIGLYLLHRGLNWEQQQTLSPYIPSNYKELQAMRQNSWEDWFIDDWTIEQVARAKAKDKVKNGTCRVTLKAMQRDLKDRFPHLEPPGRSKVDRICRKYNTRLRMIQVLGEKCIEIFLDKSELDLFTGDSNEL